MKVSILSKLDHLSERYEEVGALLSDGDIISNQNRFRTLSKEYSELELLVKTYGSYKDVMENIEEAKLLLNCLLYTSPSPRDRQKSRMPSSA